MTGLAAVCSLCEELAGESSRNRQTSLAAAFLRQVESADELEFAVRFLAGKPLRKGDSHALNVSFATLFKVVEALSGATEARFMAEYDKHGDVGEAIRNIIGGTHSYRQSTLTEPQLTIDAVKKGIDALAAATGSGSRSKKERIIEALFSRATPLEAKYLAKCLLGEMRHGFSEGLMEAALSKAFNVNLSAVRVMHMAISDLGSVARTLMQRPKHVIDPIRVTVFNPYRPMLASPVQSVSEALKIHKGETTFEFKLDGVRVQIHKKNDSVRIFSRRLSDITLSVPEIVDAVKKGITAEEAAFEGEVIAVSPKGRPLPFQHVMRRIGRVRLVPQMADKVPLKLVLFDAVHCEGERSLLDATLMHRREVLQRHACGIELTPTLKTSSFKEAEVFYQKALSEGHEGLLAKKPNSRYEPGVRGKLWLKIKRTETLDLAIVAAQYGTGYRHAWLSDYYLGARDESGNFHVVGKTFKGFTDAEIQDTTKRLLADTVGKKGRTVIVIPRLVVEVAFSEIQKSPNYSSGYALRFARILRIRYDKQPSESDAIERVEEVYRRHIHGPRCAPAS